MRVKSQKQTWKAGDFYVYLQLFYPYTRGVANSIGREKYEFMLNEKLQTRKYKVN